MASGYKVPPRINKASCIIWESCIGSSILGAEEKGLNRNISPVNINESSMSVNCPLSSLVAMVGESTFSRNGENPSKSDIGTSFTLSLGPREGVLSHKFCVFTSDRIRVSCGCRFRLEA